MAVVVEALADDGPLSREQFRDRLDAAGVPTAGQALVHVLAAASLRGLVVRGPVVDGRHAFVSVAHLAGARTGGRVTIPTRMPTSAGWPCGTWTATGRPPPPTSSHGRV